MLLSDLTTMRVGGPAREVISPTTQAELVSATLEVWSGGDEWLVLGGGSNVVVSDAGFDGTVIRVVTRGIEVQRDAASVTLRVQAGEPWDALVAHTVAEGWAGIEALSGIPGSAGAAPIQNIGAYGQELSSTLVSIDFLDYLTGEVQRVSAADLGLGYRTSALKRGREGVVLAIELRLVASGDGVVSYPQLATAMGVPLGANVPTAEIRSAVLALRASKGMVLDPADPDSVSCGSFFTNPIVSERFAHGLPAETPRWLQADDTSVKLSAAWLIEQAGVARGFALPGSRAAISSKHTLAIVNRGGATAAEVTELSRYIRGLVSARFGVELQPEPALVGY
jgi:UDP-N-acetylmuramate dehydrogenase